MRHVNCKSKENARIVDKIARTPKGLLSLGDDEFDEYLETVDSVYVESLGGHEICITVRKEVRSNTVHWYASKRYGGKLFKRYVGQEITFHSLWDAATKMPTPIFGWYTFKPKK